MTSVTGNTSLGIDWWRNDADANGVEFLFNSSFSMFLLFLRSGFFSKKFNEGNLKLPLVLLGLLLTAKGNIG